jgi:hypothetical protein
LRGVWGKKRWRLDIPHFFRIRYEHIWDEQAFRGMGKDSSLAA